MSVCLVMIVKNEAHVIERCLRSVMPFISHAVICDTGSTDGTQEIVRKLLGSWDIPLDLYEDEWVHFAHNRTLAIQRARDKGDWLLMMDADHEWHGPFFPASELTYDGYNVEHRYDGMVYGIPILMKNGFDWRYECPIHETVACDTSGPFAYLPGPPFVKVYPEGARSKDPDKYLKDAEILQKHVDQHPDDARATYYLAQSYMNYAMELESRAGKEQDSFAKVKWDMQKRQFYEKARLMYLKRVELGGWWEEKWHAQYRIAQISANLDEPFAEVLAMFLSAYQAHPGRSEPIACCARYARMKDFFAIAEMCARQALTIPKPEAGLFVEHAAYDWVAADEFAVASHYNGRTDEAIKQTEALLGNPLLPPSEKGRLERNLSFYRNPPQKAA